MSPGLLSAELAVTFPNIEQKTMEDSLFPPIARKSAISLSSENDPNEFCNHGERKIHTRGSVPASLSSSPVKFPTIDRANSTSVASLPGSRSTRHRSNMREMRSTYCRSPSCPSQLDVTREFNGVEVTVYKDRDQKSETGSSVGSTDRDDGSAKLPSIFSSKECGSRFSEPKVSNRRDKMRDRAQTLSLRRSESFMRTFVPPTDAPLSCRDTEPRASQGAALLLPIRTNTQTNKKKKKRRSRLSSDSDPETADNTPRNFTSDIHRRIGRDSDDALTAIARENDIYDDDIDTTPRSIEISSSRKVKQWMSSNQKETGQIKA